ncbi:MAG: NAD-dependent malic enzyme [Planctomycetota bacterium]
MDLPCTPAYALKFRLRIPNRPGMFARVADAVAAARGDFGTITIVDETREEVIRDVTVRASSLEHQNAISRAIGGVEGIRVLSVEDCTFAAHEGGKLEVISRHPIRNAADLAQVYTPGVARVCEAIREDPRRAWRLTIKRNTVAVVTDGSAVLGLGDIGPLAALPVMEGKAALFKTFGGVDAFPVCLSERDPARIVETVKAIAPAFGGINLEDIAAPRCFEIEARLQDALDIPVFHDDQHGTAIVVLAALSNALRIVGKEIGAVRVIFSGVGAAGVACTRLLMAAGAKRIVGCDSRGAIYRGRAENMNPAKQWYAEHTNPENVKGALADALAGADVFIGVSAPGLLRSADIKRMAKRAIVFALANPEPEIRPEEAGPFAAIMATGRSDYPNQINNVLAFPGVFRGALDVHASRITEGMKLAAAKTIAEAAGAPLRPDAIVPSTFAPGLAQGVARAVREAAVRDGVAGTRGDRIAGTDELHSPAGRP